MQNKDRLRKLCRTYTYEVQPTQLENRILLEVPNRKMQLCKLGWMATSWRVSRGNALSMKVAIRVMFYQSDDDGPVPAAEPTWCPPASTAGWWTG